MKKLLQLCLLLTVIAIILIKTPVIPYVGQLIYYSPCDQPISYKVDEVDPQFQLSRTEFLADIQQAETIWNQVTGKNLFIYDQKNGILSINLVYDGRQTLNNQITNLESQLQSEKNSIDPQMIKYQNLSADFKSKMQTLNSQISYWNSNGGAPPDEYTKLKAQQQSLQLEAIQLNELAKSLNISTDEYNTQIGQLNQTVDTYNSALQQRPEEGLYDSQNNRITIYFNISHNELLHTLAHEMGHALGLQHNQNPQSIMYPKTTTTLTASIDDANALQKICQKITIFDRIQSMINLLFHKSI